MLVVAQQNLVGAARFDGPGREAFGLARCKPGNVSGIGPFAEQNPQQPALWAKGRAAVERRDEGREIDCPGDLCDIAVAVTTLNPKGFKQRIGGQGRRIDLPGHVLKKL